MLKMSQSLYIAIFHDELLNPFALPLQCYHWLMQLLHVASSHSILKACQPTITEGQSFIFGNTNQIHKLVLFLMKDFPSQQNTIIHCLQDP